MRVLIVGAGFGGVGAAIELVRSGHTDVTILEKGDEIGGVWRANTYPGAACDIPSVLYSYSYAPNPHWSSRFSGQAEIQAYLKRVAQEYGVYDKIRFGVTVTDADFDADRGVWVVQTSEGPFEAEVFVPALGQLSRPTTPTIKGASSFEGEQWHSAEWRHDVGLAGKRVAVIGTGASAIQIVPNIQPEVAHLTLFQRSAPHISPKPERVYSQAHHAMFEKVPATQRLERLLWWLFMEYNTIGLAGNRYTTATVAWIPRLYRRFGIKDPVLRAQMTPNEPPGAKRALFASNYYPALEAENASVVTERIEEITPTGVRTADGVQHEVDVIVWCTGFTATEFVSTINVRGLGGKDLQEYWASTGARAFLGLTVPNFPNLFLMYGPNTNVGAGSIIYMHEGQAAYIRSAVDYLEATGTSYVDVREDVEEAFDAEVQRKMQTTVWLKGESWYRDENGRVTTNWPMRLLEYRRRTRKFDAADYETRVVNHDQPRFAHPARA